VLKNEAIKFSYQHIRQENVVQFACIIITLPTLAVHNAPKTKINQDKSPKFNYQLFGDLEFASHFENKTDAACRSKERLHYV
jgi:hypothetical protein